MATRREHADRSNVCTDEDINAAASMRTMEGGKVTVSTPVQLPKPFMAMWVNAAADSKPTTTDESLNADALTTSSVSGSCSVVAAVLPLIGICLQRVAPLENHR